MRRFLDATLGRFMRHFLFILVRTYYALFYNVSCSNKHLLQDTPGALILSTHVSRHDGPMLAAILYTTARLRPTVHYNEYYSWSQWLPMHVVSAIPMSSPRKWPAEKRQKRKEDTLEIIHKVMENGSCILLFPAGRVRRQEREIIKPGLSGVHDIMGYAPDTPVMVLRIDGLGKFQTARYDGFWSFLGIKKGRRHVNVRLDRVTHLDPSKPLDDFNAELEELLNS
ncbi:hypothetical protein ASD8599_01347 [Ascidiaceihabitans donghaensis]|uniref:Phospholipid/glycerol acyltransferase domain-containing protein n=1 Tax=Ascidiaceihabitans donghaensis TaxID=1510460 RepID=A0A2R8BC34_9RHOB|nr:1-acyl-sn-glycerol-3-phosphate acyltransferase [Ascidiaceihabitans donghaensis]SPH20608.1 hypothetical protein ASD8599_01347 [Ascidiaceihabitans donghaensis]